MQLVKIKIAGFKSFVDPTTIDLPSKLVAVVGPNGCGKSNVIDAVTWVMGESSPKYLRGESLTDVIFNGSTGRKPVGQASVELVFDNSDGTIGGEYAKFAEISVKRSINRESDSAYYLNGGRCRKRDVVDLFLGTGLGPRSYSIIGQNMISRIIEAKPDDLRNYLEEAAGISKYKERRHETELRIGHTKENLARVSDLQGELEKQLGHLKNQANTAEKFKQLKQQERQLRAEVYAIEWRELDSKMVEHTLQIQREETGLEARHSELSSTEKEIELMRHEQRVAHDAFQETQRHYYAVGNEITRLEQEMLHQQERAKQWEHDLRQTESDWQTTKDQLQESEDELHELQYDIEKNQPLLVVANQECSMLQDDLANADEASQIWQTRWDEFNQHMSKTTQTAQVEKVHIQHLEQRIGTLEKRREQLQQDQSRFNFSGWAHEIEEYTTKSTEIAELLESQRDSIEEINNKSATLSATQRDAHHRLDQLRSELQRLRGQQSSLEALQQTALGQRDHSTTPWLKQQHLENNARLAQQIAVEPGYEFAVEKVLGFCLQAICIEDRSEVLAHLHDFKSGNLCLIQSVAATAATARGDCTKGPLLLDKIKSPWPLTGLLDKIYVANTLDEALTLCQSLDADESVITAEGIWLNRSWLKILREDDPAAGVFQREQELKQLTTRMEQLQHTQAELEETIAEMAETMQQLEQQRQQLQQSYNQQQAQAAQINAQCKMKQERINELKLQSERCEAEQKECVAELQNAKDELQKARSIWQDALKELEEQEHKREELMREREKARQHLQKLRENVQQKIEHVHELQIQLETAKSQKISLSQTINRLQTQLASFNERKIILQSELTSMPPLDALKKSLDRALDKHVGVETELNTARNAVETLDQDFRQLETKRQHLEKDINKIRNILESLRLEWQGWKVKTETIKEQMKDTDYQLEEVLKNLAPDILIEDAEMKLNQVIQRISRLGPINLVAIEEYATCQERKQYLDKQLEDLQSGLATLEEAIAKIDKETRTRFKETFDKVNARFQELFPTIFGGGKAYLELTSDDLLQAGVTTMACPPGKRNSSIYLLSGGEKSLTALALIFSIFYLNPAPFCLLDEVDAALDDANVLRFTRLVKSMAERTQFIFISHNKITIEMGQHLIGVTMHEPGVSRLVSVDIEKAITLAGT